MRILKFTLAVLALLALLAGCGAVAVPETQPATTELVTAAETTTEEETTTEVPTTTRAPLTYAQSIPNDLLDFALIDRLFSMTLADYFREEGRTVEPEDEFEGSFYYSFSKYGPTSYFFFINKRGIELPCAMALETADLLVARKTLTLGELTQWLEKNKIKYSIHREAEVSEDELSEDDIIDCVFTVNEYGLCAYIKDTGAGDNNNVYRIFAKPKD